MQKSKNEPFVLQVKKLYFFSKPKMSVLIEYHSFILQLHVAFLFDKIKSEIEKQLLTLYNK